MEEETAHGPQGMFRDSVNTCNCNVENEILVSGMETVTGYRTEVVHAMCSV